MNREGPGRTPEKSPAARGRRRWRGFRGALFFLAGLAAACLLDRGSSAHAAAGGPGADLYSIELTEMSIAEALKRVHDATGVPIVIRKSTGRRISARSYADKDLDHILKDLLRHSDHLVQWKYSDRSLTSVDIWFFDAAPPGKTDDPGPAAGPALKGTVDRSPKWRRARPPEEGEGTGQRRMRLGRRSMPFATGDRDALPGSLTGLPGFSGGEGDGHPRDDAERPDEEGETSGSRTQAELRGGNVSPGR